MWLHMHIVCISLYDEEILTEEFHLINSIIHLQYKLIECDMYIYMYECVWEREREPQIK